MSPERPRRQPLSPAIDETIIRSLVHGFYAKVRQDSKIGPVFNHVIGDDWDHHLAKMCVLVVGDAPDRHLQRQSDGRAYAA